MANNAKIKKWFLSKVKNQGVPKKSWSKDDIEVMTINPFIETPE